MTTSFETLWYEQGETVLAYCYRCGDEIYDAHFASLGVCEECDEKDGDDL